MPDSAQSWTKAILLAVLSALVGGFSSHFYTQGQVSARIGQLERDVQRVDDNSASRRRELREELILLLAQQQNDINQVREDAWAYRRANGSK